MAGIIKGYYPGITGPALLLHYDIVRRLLAKMATALIENFISIGWKGFYSLILIWYIFIIHLSLCNSFNDQT